MNQIAQNANLDQMQFGQGLALNQMTPGPRRAFFNLSYSNGWPSKRPPAPQHV